MTDTHVTIEPAILYFGTPVVLISTQNEDGTANLAPMSSAWWLGCAACSACKRHLRRRRT
jgi:flavin reductase (DIM6/NTAB) family NADH-FMN oxidoreductase RutF